MCGSSTQSHKVLGKRMNRPQGKNPRQKVGITTTVLKCQMCGLIFSNPQPIPNSIQDHYAIDPKTYWKSDYFKLDDGYFKGEINTLMSLYKFKEGDKALDVGAGIGKCMIALNKVGFDTFGIEPSETFYAKAIEYMNIRADRLTLDSIENAQLPNDYFGFITFGAVLEHVYDPSSSIKRAMGWLKVGGIIQIEVPSSRWLVSKLINSYYYLRGLDYVTNVSPMHEPFHLYEFSLESFQKNGLVNGYEVIKSEYYVASTYMPKWLDRIFRPFMKWTNSGMQLCVWLRKNNEPV
ncbi:MAG: class I SAM-dependent methyltransferase [Cyclobacteriaceae bacterium]